VDKVAGFVNEAELHCAEGGQLGLHEGRGRSRVYQRVRRGGSLVAAEHIQPLVPLPVRRPHRRVRARQHVAVLRREEDRLPDRVAQRQRVEDRLVERLPEEDLLLQGRRRDHSTSPVDHSREHCVAQVRPRVVKVLNSDEEIWRAQRVLRSFSRGWCRRGSLQVCWVRVLRGVHQLEITAPHIQHEPHLLFVNCSSLRYFAGDD